MGMKTPELNGAKRFLRGSADDQVGGWSRKIVFFLVNNKTFPARLLVLRNNCSSESRQKCFHGYLILISVS